MGEAGESTRGPNERKASMFQRGRGTAQDSPWISAAAGWWVLGGAFVGFAVSGGIMHAYAVFFVAFLEEFGWNRAETSLAYAVAQLMSGASAPLIGLLVDRLGPRLLILGGGGLVVGGWLLGASVAGC